MRKCLCLWLQGTSPLKLVVSGPQLGIIPNLQVPDVKRDVKKTCVVTL